MFKNLFKSLIVKSAAKAGAPLNPVVKEGEKRLKETKQKLNGLRSDYAKGNFSGHPEDMLEMIEDYESIERVLLKAKKRGWVPSDAVINEVKEDIENQKAYMLSKSYSQSEIDNEIEWRNTKLGEALSGLR